MQIFMHVVTPLSATLCSKFQWSGAGKGRSMAQPVSYKKAPDDGVDVLLEMVEPSFHTNGGEQKGLHLGDGEPRKKIDYCLVYERCEEKESKDDEAKEEAEKLEGMRRAFEASLVSAGLVIEHKEHALPQVRPALISQNTISTEIYSCSFSRR